jgi:hypothetical protein
MGRKKSSILAEKRMCASLVLALILGGLGVSVLVDLRSNARIRMHPDHREWGHGKINRVLYDLMNGEDYDPAHIGPVCDYLDARYDCADFAMPSLMPILTG